MSLPLDGNPRTPARERLETVLIEHPHPEFSRGPLTTRTAATGGGNYSQKGTAAARMFISGRPDYAIHPETERLGFRETLAAHGVTQTTTYPLLPVSRQGIEDSSRAVRLPSRHRLFVAVR